MNIYKKKEGHSQILSFGILRSSNMSGWDILYFNNISYIEIRQLNRLRSGNNPWGFEGL